jgi:hypothetical protein
MLGCRLDRSNDVGLTISNETESKSCHIIDSCQIEVNTSYGILVDGDADDGLTEQWCQPTIANNMFRNSGATSDIYFKNVSGPILYGGTLSGNSHIVTDTDPLIFDPDSWQQINLGNASVDRTTTTPTIVEYGTYHQRVHCLAKSGSQVSHTGDTDDTTLATIPISRRVLGKNGVIRVTSIWSHTNSANAKYMRTKLQDVIVNGTTATTSSSSQIIAHLVGRDEFASRVGPATDLNGYGSSTSSTFISSANAENALTITITGKVANSTETITLEAYIVEIIP